MTIKNKNDLTTLAIGLLSFVTTSYLFSFFLSSGDDTKEKETYINISSGYYGDINLTKDQFQRYFERMCAENKFTIMSSCIVDYAIEINYKNILLVPKHLQTNGLCRLSIKTDISFLSLTDFTLRHDYNDLVAYAIELYGEDSVNNFVKKDE